MTSKVDILLVCYPEYRCEIERYYRRDPVFAEICDDIADLEKIIRQLERIGDPARADIVKDAQILLNELHGEAIRTIHERLAAERARADEDEARRGGER